MADCRGRCRQQRLHRHSGAYEDAFGAKHLAVSKRRTKRYYAKFGSNDHWTVIDAFTGQIALFNGRFLGELGEKTAAEYCLVLNEIDHRRRKEAGFP